MPEGIVPELLIVLAALAIVGAVFFLTRRRPPEEIEPHVAEAPDGGSAAAVDEQEAEAAPVEPAAVAVVERPSLRERLAKSRRFLADRLADAFGSGPSDESWEDIEAALIQADVGVETATRIANDLKSKARERNVTDAAGLRALLAEELVELFHRDESRDLVLAPEGTTVWLVVGVNGTGKTTTIGKLATDMGRHGKQVALAAADTFRAAADEQLGIWAERADAQLVSHQPGADPGAVAFDAYKFANARGLDLLIVDTAGRLHTKQPLMDELSKVRRVIEKQGDVHESLLVVDATAGQNGLIQAREFAEAAGVTGVVLTKLDGTAKGGIALAIENTLDIPIKLIGVGEGVDDLQPFDPEAFVDALLS